jgi:hypothetical protein
MTTPLPAAALGRVVATAAIHHDCNDNKKFAADVRLCLERHMKGDDGDLDEEDKLANEEARFTKTGGRVMSAYKIQSPEYPSGRTPVWIITEGIGTPDAYTTILYPDEY